MRDTGLRKGTPGSYILLLVLEEACEVTVGRLGTVDLRPGLEPALSTRLLLRPVIRHAQRCFVTSECSTCCQTRLRAPRLENPTAQGVSPVSRQTPVDSADLGYVGSALGPGGLRARLARHASPSPRKHWHIDFLLPHARVTGALVVESPERIECALASWLAELADSCVPGFGSSDCRCEGHLFFLGPDADESELIARAMASVSARYVPVDELVGREPPMG